MFEHDLTELSTPDLLESAAWHRAEANRVDARLLEHALVYADRFHPDACPARPGRRACDGRERAVVLGGDGCPEIAEFAIAEFAAILGISPQVGERLLGEALALRHRFSFTWARVLNGEATPWKARQIVAACLKLSEPAAQHVDQRVARLVDSITPYRLERIIRAAKTHADPDLARAEADEVACERGVFVGQSNQHGTKTMFIKAPAGAVIRHNATIDDIAAALKTFGDTRPVQHRRADAIGIIADPRYTQELLTQARQNHTNTTATTAGISTASSPTTAPIGDTTISGPAIGPIDTTTASSSAAAPIGTTTASACGVFTGGETAGRGGAACPAANSSAGLGVCGDDVPSDWPTGSAESSRDEEVDDWPADRITDWAEPGPDEEGDRDAPHPSVSDLPDPLDRPHGTPVEPLGHDLHGDPDDGHPMDPEAQRALHARLAQIKHDAYTHPSRPRVRPGQTEIYVHLTDQTLATGTGVLRAEGIGPLLATQLSELVGHGPYTVKPVIDLNDAVSVDAYEIPDRIRERVKLTHPVELFPFGTRETTRAMDLDHIQPYDPLGPPGQTNTLNLAPLGRFGHRVKTHAQGWHVRRIDHKTLEWDTPHGFVFHVDPTGTHRVQ